LSGYLCLNICDIPWFVRKTKVNFANSTIEELREAHRSDEDRITSRRLFGLIKLYEERSVNEISSFMEISESVIQRWIKWREIKLNWLANWFATDKQQLVTKLYDVLSEVMTQNEKISSTISYSALFS
jgi:hypothetical protein